MRRWNLHVLAEERGVEVWDLEEYPSTYIDELLAFYERRAESMKGGNSGGTGGA